MICVIYASKAHDTVTDEEVDKILTSAEIKNAKLGVTGALVFDGRRFCQLLEGDEDGVSEVFDHIRKDTRHCDIDVIARQPIRDRRFPGWAMVQVDETEFKTMLDGLTA